MQNNQTQQNPQYLQEDEIDLKELFLTLWKNKIFIVVFTILVTVLAFFYTNSKTPIYEAKSVIEIGEYKNIDNTGMLQIEKTADVVFELNTLFATTQNKTKENKSWIKSVSMPKGTSTFIEITTQAFSTDDAKKYIEEILKHLQTKHGKLIQNIKDERAKELEIIQTQINSFDNMKNEFRGNNNLSSIEMIELLKLVEKYDDLSIEKENLENILSENNYTNTQFLGNIVSNENPVEPKKALIIVVAFVTGFILAVFLVFFRDFIRSFRNETK